MFERLRDAFRAALDAAAGPADMRALARQMREAVVDAKVAVAEIQEAVARTDRDLAELTLDQKQAWVLLALLFAYDKAKPDDWDIYRAAYDIRRRVAEALGTDDPKEVRPNDGT